MSRAEREAAYIFGRPAVNRVMSDPVTAGSVLMNRQESQQVHQAIDTLLPLLATPQDAVAYGQTLPTEIQQAVIYLWLGYGKHTLKNLGVIEA